METVKFKYLLDDHLPPVETAVYGLQWFLVTVPCIIILGAIAGGIADGDSAAGQLRYLQKLFLLTGLIMLVQVLRGHRLPLIVGPAAVLLSGIVATQTNTTGGAAYFSIALCGLVLAGLSWFKLLHRLSRLFTPRIVGIVLLLIAFTLLPTILNLITSGSDNPFIQMAFAMIMILLLLLGQRLLPDILKSTLVAWALLVGSLAYYTLVAGAWPQTAPTPAAAGGWQLAVDGFEFDSVVFISFLFCFLALTANDLGSIQSIAGLLGVTDAAKRSNDGLFVTGLGNVLAGLLGVIGPVNYSLSSGIMLATGCASRFPLAVAAGALSIVAFIPAIIAIFSYVPPVVIGSLLCFIMCSQVAAGMLVLGKDLATSGFETGMIVGLSLMLGTLAAFLPAQVTTAIPAVVRPLVTNGFVVGITAALLLEHVIYSKTKV
ncbi:conserved membrane hypothetical protein [uncultured Sporomusa sp.]|uniref:Xanthine permease n=1 Tax=uncultured Sporomusa sp. TaxID=307249 RepID=A0A212M0Q6_9FIRM|nr:solute carrier family 23 protein [uncultured Sporomusa sp.]SCM83392.1 conserved membrane hypothetical protein [uncultured Sporomusa sp.]